MGWNDRINSNNDKPVVMSTILAVLFAVSRVVLLLVTYIWAQPLLVQIMMDFGLPAANGGLLVLATQIGYAIGILCIVPLWRFSSKKKTDYISNVFGGTYVNSMFQ